MISALALLGAGAPAVFTTHRILGRVRRLTAERARTRTLRALVDAFARELGVGALPVDAAGHALAAVSGAPEVRGRAGAAGRALVEDLAVEVRRVRLGAVPGQGAGVGACSAESLSADQITSHLPDPGPADPDPADPSPGDPSPGDADVKRLLAVWASSHRHGTALGRLMERLRTDLDARLTHLGHTSSALAGARLTETILLLLPFGALALGQSMGLRPGAFLVGNILGVLLLVMGVFLGCAGALWTESLTVTVLGGVGRRAGPSAAGRTLRGKERAETGHGLSGLDAARLLDLFAESLAAGLPLAVAWRAAVDGGDAGDGTVSDDSVRRVATLLSLGAGVSAWEPLRDDSSFGPVARLAESGARNGARLAEGVRAQAERLRGEAADASLAGAERVLVVVAAPLTLCFLPAFVLVGLIPLVVGFAGI